MLTLSLLLLMISGQYIIADDVTDGTDLVMSFLVHRHGDRTPVESQLSFSNDPDALKVLSEPYGYGQLTTAGKKTAYALGQAIRARYNELLAPQYNRSEVYVRSTDSTRTKMTVLTALAYIYRPVARDGWNPVLDWEPVPYTTVPTKYDFNLAYLNCPVFETAYLQLYVSESPSMAEKYGSLLELLTEQVGYNITSMPGLVYPIYDVYTSQKSLGLAIDPAVEAVWDELVAAAGDSIALSFGDENYIDLQAGVLLNEFYEYSAQAIAGDDTQRLRIYSAHDFNVYSFEAVTKVSPRQGVPKYASFLSLEVRKVVETGQYVVLPVYLPEPGADVMYLQVEGCDLLCDYDQFVELTQGYAMDISTYREKCEFSEDIEINDSSIA